MDTPQVSLYGPVTGPALLFEATCGGNSVANVFVMGQSVGVRVRNAALLRFTDVGVDAAANSDGGD